MEEQDIQVGGVAARLGWDDGDGTKEFLARNVHPSKIDQVIHFYGIPYVYKNDIGKFLKYGIQPIHQRIVHDHFYTVLKASGHSVENFDYAKMQEDYDREHKGESVGLDLKVNMDLFEEKMAKTIPEDTISVPKEFMNQMMENQRLMTEEIKGLKDKFLTPIKKNDGGNNNDTDGESESYESSKPVGKEDEKAKGGETTGT